MTVLVSRDIATVSAWSMLVIPNHNRKASPEGSSGSRLMVEAVSSLLRGISNKPFRPKEGRSMTRTITSTDHDSSMVYSDSAALASELNRYGPDVSPRHGTHALNKWAPQESHHSAPVARSSDRCSRHIYREVVSGETMVSPDRTV